MWTLAGARRLLWIAPVSDNIVTAHLRAIRVDLARLKVDMIEVKERLGLLEGGQTSLSRRVDRLAGDVEQIKRRLDLVDAP